MFLLSLFFAPKKRVKKKFLGAKEKSEEEVSL